MSDEKNSATSSEENAIAHLLLGKPSNDQAEISDSISESDLQAMAANKLGNAERERVIGTLNSDPNLYRQWLLMAEDTLAVADKTTKTALKQKVNYLDRLRELLDSFFTWPAMTSAGLGLALGVVVVLPQNPSIPPPGSDPLIVQVHDPVSAPPKASFDSTFDLNNLYRCAVLTTATLLESRICISKTTSKQHWLYQSERGSPIALDQPTQADNISMILSHKQNLAILLDRDNSQFIEIFTVQTKDNLVLPSLLLSKNVAPLDSVTLSLQALDNEKLTYTVSSQPNETRVIYFNK